jgi:hypothetical protein
MRFIAKIFLLDTSGKFVVVAKERRGERRYIEMPDGVRIRQTRTS